uniref:DUF4806 domain-containing protein n=1 Tax=Haemonchus placei TaxID=6290 RepID=A0A158QM18_HAEPC
MEPNTVIDEGLEKYGDLSRREKLLLLRLYCHIPEDLEQYFKAVFGDSGLHHTHAYHYFKKRIMDNTDWSQPGKMVVTYRSSPLTLKQWDARFVYEQLDNGKIAFGISRSPFSKEFLKKRGHLYRMVAMMWMTTLSFAAFHAKMSKHLSWNCVSPLQRKVVTAETPKFHNERLLKRLYHHQALPVNHISHLLSTLRLVLLLPKDSHSGSRELPFSIASILQKPNSNMKCGIGSAFKPYVAGQMPNCSNLLSTAPYPVLPCGLNWSCDHPFPFFTAGNNPFCTIVPNSCGHKNDFILGNSAGAVNSNDHHKKQTTAGTHPCSMVSEVLPPFHTRTPNSHLSNLNEESQLSPTLKDVTVSHEGTEESCDDPMFVNENDSALNIQPPAVISLPSILVSTLAMFRSNN